MDAPPLTSERKRELAELRTRAYGPDADIEFDANALARLIELEDLVRSDAVAPVAVTERRDDPRPARAAAEATVSGSAAAADDRVSAVTAARAWWRRVPVWAVAVGTAAIGLVVGLTVPALMSPHPTTTLHPAPIEGAELDFQMYGIEADAPVRYQSFHDLEVWSAETEQGSVCIVVTTASAEWMAAGCAPEPLIPTADINIYPGIRPIDGLELSDGSVVRFVLRDDVMEVWIAETAEGA